MSSSSSTECVTFRAGFAPLTTLLLHTTNLTDLEGWLAQRRNEAPAMFDNLPCAIDVSALNHTDDQTEEIHLNDIVTVCRRYGLMPIGVRNVTPLWRPQLAACSLADLGRQANRQTPEPSQAASPAQATTKALNTDDIPNRVLKIQHGNVRSGQQVYSDGDLIVMGMISAGAEVLARGDIHIFGPLRGRALAGVKGDANAIISCQQFEAELIAIAGQYRLFEQQPEPFQKPVVIQLQDDRLNIEHDC